MVIVICFISLIVVKILNILSFYKIFQMDLKMASILFFIEMFFRNDEFDVKLKKKTYLKCFLFLSMDDILRKLRTFKFTKRVEMINFYYNLQVFSFSKIGPRCVLEAVQRN